MVCAPATLDAQTTSLEVGVASLDGAHTPLLGVRVSPPDGALLRIEGSFDAYPRLLLVPALVGHADLSFAPSLRLGRIALVGRVGGTLLLGAGMAGGVSSEGYHGGAGIVVVVDSGTTVRLDYTYRRFPGADDWETASSVTFGFVVHYRGRRGGGNG